MVGEKYMPAPRSVSGLEALRTVLRHCIRIVSLCCRINLAYLI
jgi:hypothetical protein